MKGYPANKRDLKKQQYVCYYCGEKFLSLPSQVKGPVVRCGRECPKAKEVRHCIRCGDPFEAYRNQHKKVCSKSCTGISRGDTIEHHGLPRYSAKRRSIYMKGDFIDRREVFERDSWVCRICGESIDPELKFPSKRAATLDHIIPLSKGGLHVWENVAAAHSECNAAKGSNLPEEFDSSHAVR